MFSSFKYHDRYMHAKGSQVWLSKFDGTHAFMKASGFSIVAGLAGKGISFQFGKLYLAVGKGNVLALVANSGSAAFKKSATFMVSKVESLRVRDQFLVMLF